MVGMSGTVGTVTIASHGPRCFEAYLAQSSAEPGSEKRPAILVLSDMFGLNEPIRAVADHYANRGHAALVPNLFWRSEIPGAISYDDPQHAKAWARLKALDLDVVSADMRAATDWLRAHPLGKFASVVGQRDVRRAGMLAAEAPRRLPVSHREHVHVRLRQVQTLSASVERAPAEAASCPHRQPVISGISSP